MDFENLLVSSEGAVAVVTVNRPKVLNALNVATVNELHACVTELRDHPSVRAIVITGSGEKSFVAGADIAEIRELNLVTGKEFAERGNALYSLIETLSKPVIAAVNGFALGGGCELAMACHLRLAAENAKFGQPEINLGIIPGYGGTQRLARLVGRGRALDLLLSGRLIGAQEALNYGLVEQVLPATELIPAAQKLASELAMKPTQAVKAILACVRDGLDTDLETGLAIEESWFAFCCGTEDKLEGTSAFLEKRKADFKGR